MAKRSIHGYVELASGLGELTSSRAKEAARELLELSGVEGSSKKVAKQASRLADDLLRAAESNRQHLVALVRTEVAAALEKVDVNGMMADVQALGATVTGLASQVEEITRRTGEQAASAVSGADDAVPEPARVAPRSPAPATKATSTESAPAKKAPAKKAPAKKCSGEEGAGEEGAGEEGAREEGAREEGAREEGAREEGAREEGAREEGAREEGAREEGAREEGAREEGAREEGRLGW